MGKYIAKRLGIALIVLFGITVVDFFIMTLAGNPIEILSGGPRINEAQLDQKAANLGLDKPVYIQYFIWLGQVLRGNLGTSYKSYEPVSDMIASHIGPTLILMGTALLISTILSAIFGIISAVHEHGKSDYIIQTFAFLGQSVPGFFLALLLIWLFSVKLGILPSNGMRELGSEGSGVQFRYLILPAAVLSFEMSGRNIRYIRSSMLEILNKDYLRTAEAKGIGKRRVILVHALKNALIPIITVFGMEIPNLFGGAVVIEEIFGWPGLGLMTMNAVLDRDYPVIMGVCLLSAVVVLVSNIAVDLLYALVDPSIRLE
ncbi:MAG: ABC transporter permease [Lachnospiraceae bacterium]|jgi:peptide/nickel transport system permease protein